MVRAGIDSVSINPDAAVFTRKLVASIEQRIMLEKALGKVKIAHALKIDPDWDFPDHDEGESNSLNNWLFYFPISSKCSSISSSRKDGETSFTPTLFNCFNSRNTVPLPISEAIKTFASTTNN
ncbi:MAG: hypothetical protein QXY99_05060 [Thermoproteota archaeon]